MNSKIKNLLNLPFGYPHLIFNLKDREFRISKSIIFMNVVSVEVILVRFIDE